MITLHPVSAGTGIDYLMNTVIAADTTVGKRDAHDYWASGGDTPGQWLGRGANTLGLFGQVTQDQADAIFKHGVHPRTGASLGRPWPRYPTVEERYADLLRAEPNATEARRRQLRATAEAAGEQTARSAWEMVFSPVKSFSVLWGTADDEARAQLEAVEAEAFAKVWARIEADACWTRLGAGGVAQVGGEGLTAAVFVHRSSRAGDPDFHRHVAISTKVRHGDKWLALDARPLHRLTVMFSEMYTTELERAVAARLGITAAPRADSIRPDKRPVREFRGVSARMVRAFSARRRQTEAAYEAMLREFRSREGREPGRAEQYRIAQVAALAGRPNKESHSPAAERRRWRRQAKSLGLRRPDRWVESARRESANHARLLDRETRRYDRNGLARWLPGAHAGADSGAQAQRVIGFAGDGEPIFQPTLEKVTEQTLQVLQSQRESWTRTNAQAEAYRQLTAARWHLDAGDTFDQILRQVTDAVLSPDRCELITPPELIPVPGQYLRADGTPIFTQAYAARYTSHALKQAEADLVEAATRPTAVRQLTVEQVDRALAAGDARRGFSPTPEQRAIVHAIFTGDTRAQAVIGPAGTGKTTIMALVREVAAAHRIPVLGLAGGQVQADHLRAEAGIRAENIARWRAMSEHVARGEPDWTLAPGTILIIDEAGQASTPDLAALLEQVHAAGGRMLPVGDPRQLGSPGVGGALALLEADAGALYLAEVRRFRDVAGALRTWEIDASLAIAAGDPAASFDAYDARGRIHAGTADQMKDAAYRAWLRDTGDGLVSVLIAPDNATVAEMSARARTDRVVAGVVDDTHTVELADGNRAGRGDQVLTRKNDRRISTTGTRQWVRNGDLWNVLRVEGDSALRVRHTVTGRVAVLPVGYVTGGGVELGYAITKNRVQGLTVDTGHGILTDREDRNAAYPTATRGRYANHLYLVTQGEADLETGAIPPAKTARQVWAQLLTRDGTQPSATMRQRTEWQAAESLGPAVARLRFVLDDLADTHAQRAVHALLGPDAGGAVTSAPAWPALRAQLLALADDGWDSDRLLTRAWTTRDMAGADDVAAVLHARIRRLAAGEPAAESALRRAATDLQPSTGVTYHGPAAVRGDDVLAALGLTVPEPDPADLRLVYAHQLAAAIRARAEHLADQMRADAATGTGWAAAYGPEPDGVPAIVAWRDQLAAAASYRELAGYTGSDPTGPAPTADDAGLRGLWRAAQAQPDQTSRRGRAEQAAADGPAWLDALGPIPPASDPHRAQWLDAADAILTYRSLWEYGREDAALGEPPTDPVQLRDYRTASKAIAAWRQATPSEELAALGTSTLEAIGVDGDQAAQRAAAAAAELAALAAAEHAATAAAQDAEDAANRAALAARNATTPAQRARATELDTLAQAAADRARRATAHLAETADHARHLAPDALAARETARRGRDARRLAAARASGPQPGPDTTTVAHWTRRPHGDASDTELLAIAAAALAEAAQLDQHGGQPPLGVRAGADADELRELAAALHREARIRALLPDEQRQHEHRERLDAARPVRPDPSEQEVPEPELTKPNPPWGAAPYGELTDRQLTQRLTTTVNTARLHRREARDAERAASELAAAAAAGNGPNLRAATEHRARLRRRAQAAQAVAGLTEEARRLADERDATSVRLGQIDVQLSVTGALGRPALRGEQRTHAAEQASRLRTQLRDLDRRHAVLDDQLTRARATVGDQPASEAVAAWQQAEQAWPVTSEQARARDSDAAQVQTERAADQAARAATAERRTAQMRAEMTRRARLDPQTAEREAAARTNQPGRVPARPDGRGRDDRPEPRYPDRRRPRPDRDGPDWRGPSL